MANRPHRRAFSTPPGRRRALAVVVAACVVVAVVGAGAAHGATGPLQRYIVTFAPTPSGSFAAAAAPVDALTATAVRPLTDEVAVVTSRLTASELAAAPNVVAVELDRPLTLAAFGDEPGDALQWSLANPGGRLSTGWTATAGADVDAHRAWTLSTGVGAVVAIGDTGVQADHPDLRDNMWRNTKETSCTNRVDDDGNGLVDDCRGWDFGDRDNDPSPNTATNAAHGTHVAGIVAAKRNGVGISGVAPDATIMPLKISDSAGTLTLSNGIASIVYAADHGADVYNASWGASGTSLALQNALTYAGTKGMTVVAAAGNSSLVLSDTVRYMPASYGSLLANVTTVASSDFTDQLSTFSNRGAVTLTAPGSTILSTVPGSQHATMSGTSMAAPHVAGAVALLASQHPEWSPTQVRARLVATAETGSGLAQGGAGRLNAAVALGAGARSGPPPSLPIVQTVGTATPRQALVTYAHGVPTGVTGYTARAIAPDGSTVSTATAPASARSIALTGLAPSTTYRITVTASTSTTTLPAAPMAVTTPAWKVPPLPAGGITIRPNAGVVDVTWVLPADPLTKIVVQPVGGKAVTLKPGATGAQLPNPGRAGDLTVAVTLSNKNGSTTATATAVVVAAIPAAPPATVTARSAKAASVDWQAPAGWVTGYLVTFDGRTTKLAATKRTLAVALKRTGTFAVTVTAVNPFGPGTPTSLTLTVP